MNNNMLTIVLIVLSFLAIAEEKTPLVNSNDASTSAKDIDLRRKIAARRRYEHFGGDVVRPETKAGLITVVNCQTSVDKEVLDEGVEYLCDATHFNIRIIDGAFSVTNVLVQGNASMFIIEDDALPTMLLAPENKWAVLNVRLLKTGRGEKQTFFKARVLKEMSRTFAGLCGAISSNYPNSLTAGIYSLDQLDRKIDNRLSVDVIARLAPNVEAIGVKPAKITSYLKACEEGWAPAPTNDVQKVIWEKIKAEKDQKPSNPIKVNFDPKTAPKVSE